MVDSGTGKGGRAAFGTVEGGLYGVSLAGDVVYGAVCFEVEYSIIIQEYTASRLYIVYDDDV